MADHPEVIYLDPLCDDCRAAHEQAFWWDQQDDAGCHRPDCPLKPTKYIRADLWDDQIEIITELVISDQMMEMSKLLDENRRLKAEIETLHERRGFS